MALVVLVTASLAGPARATEEEYEFPKTFPPLEQALAAARQAGRPLVIDLSGET